MTVAADHVASIISPFTAENRSGTFAEIPVPFQPALLWILMDRAILRRHLDLAQGHAEGERHMGCQKEIISSFEAAGHDATEAKRLLAWRISEARLMASPDVRAL